MSFDLSVESPIPIPSDLGSQWEIALRALDVSVEVLPEFSPATWGGGFLPMKALAVPELLIGTVLNPPALSGFEVYFDQDAVWFRSAMGRTSTEFALMALSAGVLAAQVGGVYVDPQSGVRADAAVAVQAAKQTISEYLKEVPESELRQYRWGDWDSGGVEPLP